MRNRSDQSLGLPHRRWRAAAVTFNLAPCAYIHDSWLEDMAHGALLAGLRSETRASAWISHHILNRLEIVDDFWSDFSAPRTRLALLDSTALEMLLLHVGLALRHAEVRNEISGERIRRLRGELGDAAYTFAVKRAPFLGKVPELDYQPEDLDVRSRMILVGSRLSLPADAMESRGFAQRVALKLPRPIGQEILDGVANTKHSDAGQGALPGIVKTLVKEFLPEWHALFA